MPQVFYGKNNQNDDLIVTLRLSIFTFQVSSNTGTPTSTL